MANDVNITPDMINNFVNMLQHNNNNSNSDSNSDIDNENSPSNSINFEDIFSKFSQNMNNSGNSTSSDSSPSIDFDTIIKIKSIMETLNTKNDPKSNLLYSLKPYLRKSKQAKLDQYVNIMKISQVTNLFKNEKGDKK